MQGVFALGVVWGWLSAPLSERRGTALLLVAAAASLQSLETVWVIGTRAAILLLGGWLLGLLVHVVFRTALRMRLRRRTTS